MPYGSAGARRRAHYAARLNNTVAPAITGTAQVGQTLTTTNGTWANATGATYTRQWKRGTTSVGAGATTYVPVVGDIGSPITCEVAAALPNGAIVTATSNATSNVIA
jgi:hypothetical protein